MTTREQIENEDRLSGPEYPIGTKFSMPDGGIMEVTNLMLGSAGEKLRTLTVDGKNMTVTAAQITTKIAAGIIKILQ